MHSLSSLRLLPLSRSPFLRPRFCNLARSSFQRGIITHKRPSSIPLAGVVASVSSIATITCASAHSIDVRKYSIRTPCSTTLSPLIDQHANCTNSPAGSKRTEAEQREAKAVIRDPCDWPAYHPWEDVTINPAYIESQSERLVAQELCPFGWG